VVDATTLEALFRKVGALRERVETVFGGTLLAVLDLPSKLPVHLWWDEDAAANEKRFLEQLRAVLPPGVLLGLDAGFYAFPWFDWLTAHGAWFLTRARAKMAFEVGQVLAETPTVRDRVIRLGQYRANRCAHPVRLVEVLVGGAWRGYLTNVLDPAVLPPADVVDLYGRRWRVEEAFLLVKRLLGLAYLWTGAANGIQLQLWATWLLYALLGDLSDAVAEELDQPLDRISIELVYRGLYFFAGAHARGQATDPVAYLAAQPDLGIVKRRRKCRERQRPPFDTPLRSLTCDPSHAVRPYMNPRSFILARAAALASGVSGPSTRPLKPWTRRAPPNSTRRTSCSSPGSQRTVAPAGMSRRIPKAAARSNRRRRLASKTWKCEPTWTGQTEVLRIRRV